MRFIEKERKILDAETTLKTVVSHSITNFTHGLLSGLSIACINTGNPLIIGCAYYVFKRFDSKILNRDKYTTKLGKDYIFPIPSTMGFVIGCYLSLQLQERIL